MKNRITHPLLLGPLLFLALEAAVHLHACAYPFATEYLWWEGPLSLSIQNCSSKGE